MWDSFLEPNKYDTTISQHYKDVSTVKTAYTKNYQYKSIKKQHNSISQKTHALLKFYFKSFQHEWCSCRPNCTWVHDRAYWMNFGQSFLKASVKEYVDSHSTKVLHRMSHLNETSSRLNKCCIIQQREMFHRWLGQISIDGGLNRKVLFEWDIC